jgi:hypothetical protein
MDPHSINFPDDPDPLARYRREFELQEEELARQRRREEREWQRTQRGSTVRVPDSEALEVIVAPKGWARDRAAVEADVDGRIAAAIETLRSEINKGDCEVLRAVETAIIPLVEKVGDGLRKKIKGVDQKLAELEQLLHRQRSLHAEPIDLPRIPLRSSRRDIRVN